ncbi:MULTISPECIES: hypothetical protein [Macrococcus]|uniref:PepSY domain-containing protein n=1 Tax=Macrococcus psychrotolerans TaxID=3039389 RepID=A0AAT9P199_9STAP|nr:MULTISPECIES: hypothetical protein [Macrococcus]MDJ1111584.1 hypothetical protein [Macrococcus sp. S115]QYA32318.1 hypothetical protein KYI10_07965 [Macrococcus sp. 19Msa1099]QYA37125.1 hypothetical protein KYI07_07955 [Macrococcus caseolyticus]QYA75833.1 hypothetical protein KYI12_07955 [Macrococcus caseolyticus]
MKKRYLLIIPVIIALLYMSKDRMTMKHPKKVLDQTKHAYKDVTGSAINYTPEKIHKFGSITHVYRGMINTKTTTYEFIADCYSGELIDVFEIQSL